MFWANMKAVTRWWAGPASPQWGRRLNVFRDLNLTEKGVRVWQDVVCGKVCVCGRCVCVWKGVCASVCACVDIWQNVRVFIVYLCDLLAPLMLRGDLLAPLMLRGDLLAPLTLRGDLLAPLTL